MRRVRRNKCVGRGHSGGAFAAGPTRLRCTQEREYLVLVSPDTPGSQEENLVRTVAPAVQGQTKKGSRCVATA